MWSRDFSKGGNKGGVGRWKLTEGGEEEREGENMKGKEKKREGEEGSLTSAVRYARYLPRPSQPRPPDKPIHTAAFRSRRMTERACSRLSQI